MFTINSSVLNEKFEIDRASSQYRVSKKMSTSLEKNSLVLKSEKSANYILLDRNNHKINETESHWNQ